MEGFIMNKDINIFIRDTQQNIFNTGADVDNKFAVATDTGSVFVSRDGGWLEWKAQSSIIGEYNLPGTELIIPHAPIVHVDATDINTLLTKDSQAPTQNQQVAVVNSQVGDYVLTQPESTKRPTYHDDLLNSRPGLRFRDTQFLKTHNPAQIKNTYKNDFTIFMVFKPKKIWKNWNNTNDETDPNVQLETTNSHWTLYDCAGGFHDYESSYLRTVYESTTHPTYFRYTLYGGGEYTHHNINKNSGDLSELGLNPREDVLIHVRRITSDALGETLNTDILSYNGDAYCVRNNVNNDTTTVRFRGLTLAGGFRGVAEIDVGEYLMFNGALNNQQLNQVGSHLGTKWGTAWKDFK